jgi:hypothetical protein
VVVVSVVGAGPQAASRAVQPSNAAAAVRHLVMCHGRRRPTIRDFSVRHEEKT